MNKINVQGKLTQSDGVASLAGTHDIILRLYDAPMGGNLRFAERHNVVELGTTGVFNLMMGQGVVLSSPNVVLDNLAFNTQYYLSIAVDAEPEMNERQVLGTSAYAAGAFRQW